MEDFIKFEDTVEEAGFDLSEMFESVDTSGMRTRITSPGTKEFVFELVREWDYIPSPMCIRGLEGFTVYGKKIGPISDGISSQIANMVKAVKKYFERDERITESRSSFRRILDYIHYQKPNIVAYLRGLSPKGWKPTEQPEHKSWLQKRNEKQEAERAERVRGRINKLMQKYGQPVRSPSKKKSWAREHAQEMNLNDFLIEKDGAIDMERD